MNLLFRVIFACACTNTHHKLAMDALCHLRCRRARRWQNLFLKYHKLYLKGAKAPDVKFKDFRNHVLHVRDDNWGGAPRAARQWYDRTVESLRQEDWPEAIHAAGVLSHYYMDPIQPFHTGQSQAESNIHRAAEWSITKSYDLITDLLDKSISLPEVAAPRGPDWLEQMVIQGAQAANPHYETLIEHYDFDAGVKNPAAGLDRTSHEILAHLLAHAAIGFARILERAFEEARAVAPRTDISLQGFLATTKIPIYWVTKRMASAREAAKVKATYRELKKTGKVDQTLSEDDRTIRDLHANEVVRTEKAPTAEPATSSTPPDSIEPQTVRLEDSAVRSDGESTFQGSELRFHLRSDSQVVDAPSIGAKTARRLAKIGVKTVADLLDLDPQAAAEKLTQRYITDTVIRVWQDQARLVCHIPEIRGHDAALMVACGWNDPDRIAGTEPRELFAAVDQYVDSSEGQRIVRAGKRPDLAEVSKWIEMAKRSRSMKAA